MNFQNVYDSIKKTNGASYNFFTGELNPDKGYMVALQGYDHKYPIPHTYDEFRNSVVEKYLSYTEIWKEITQRKDVFIGFWINNDELVIDLSELVDEMEDAWEKGLERFQFAIYDNANKHDINLPTVGF